MLQVSWFGGFLKKKFREEEPVGRKKVDRKFAEAEPHKLLTSKHNGSVFDSYHVCHSRIRSYSA